MSRAAAKPKPASMPAWPADAVERRSVKSLLAYPRNARTHSPDQVAQIAASMREFGWTVPVLVDEQGVIIAGHGRIEAANMLGLAEVPVMVAAGWTEAQKRAYRLADNQIPMNAGWDTELLRLELTDLKLENYDLNLTGFDDLQLVSFMAGGPSAADPEAVPDPPPTPVSKRGDLWLLGDHRLLCGDATSADDVARLLEDEQASIVITDPPYGVDYVSIRASQGDMGHRDIENDKLDGPALQAFLESIIKASLPHLVENPAFYMWHPMLTQGTFFAAAAAAADILIHRQIIWVKPSLVFGRGDYHWRHELCFYGWIRGKRCNWYSGRDQTTVWELGRENDGVHPTQKPIECMKRPIENNSRPGDAIYDPFLGSGTTLIAAEMTARKCFGLEIDPGYCDVIVKRWETFTGKEAILDAPGKPIYARVQADRAKSAPKRKRRPKAPPQL